MDSNTGLMRYSDLPRPQDVAIPAHLVEDAKKCTDLGVEFHSKANPFPALRDWAISARAMKEKENRDALDDIHRMEDRMQVAAKGSVGAGKPLAFSLARMHAHALANVKKKKLKKFRRLQKKRGVR